MEIGFGNKTTNTGHLTEENTPSIHILLNRSGRDAVSQSKDGRLFHRKISGPRAPSYGLLRLSDTHEE